jgi:cell division GTPase FtsZ
MMQTFNAIDFETASDRFHIIGMGSSGSNLTMQLFQMGLRVQFTVIINSERTYPESFHIVNFTLPECGHYRNRNWPSKKLSLTKKITSLFQEGHIYVFLLGLGGTGTVLLYTLIPWLLEKGIVFKIICSYPTLWEGKRRVNTAEVLFNKMNDQPFFQCFRLDDLMEISGKTTILETFQKSDEHFYSLLTKLDLQQN